MQSDDGKRLEGDILEEGDSDEVSSEEGSCSSEFVPSTWDSSLTPSKSSIRSSSITVVSIFSLLCYFAL